MIAEDDPDDLFLLQHALRKVCPGLAITAVSDGVELLAHLQSGAASALPDLVFLDLNMPRMDGREVLAVLQDHPRLSAIPVVVMTTSQEPEDRERAKALKVAAWVTKPDQFAPMVAIARQILEQECPSAVKG